MATVTLKRYLELLNKFVEENPHTLELLVLDNRYNSITENLMFEEGYFKRNLLKENTFLNKDRFEDLTIDENQCVNAITIC